ncbi:MAG: GNAT family N-acetyltransferase [Pseudomonadota bacterium]
MPPVSELFDAIDATWPPARLLRQPPWELRVGEGGGKRVSAATAFGPLRDAAISEAEGAMRSLGQSPLFMLRAEDKVLDAALAERGYRLVDPVSVLVSPLSALTDRPVPPVTCFTVWEPLAIMKEIWAQGGIGSARLAVMHRAATKTGLFGRCGNRPAGCGFAAVSGEIAMVHAVEVLPGMRRRGVAGWIMRQAAFWARDHGAKHIVVLCTDANKSALQLYSGLGFERAARYHYRQ